MFAFSDFISDDSSVPGPFASGDPAGDLGNQILAEIGCCNI